MALSDDATGLAALLHNLTQPDTEAIRNAELQLKPILKDQRCIPALFEVLSARDSQPPAVRHVAAILMRKRVSGHYGNLSTEIKAKIHTDILQLLASETERNVRKGAIGVTSMICKLQNPPGGPDAPAPAGYVPWPELFAFISAASQDANPDARELAFLLMFELTETIATFLESQFQSMAELFNAALTNAHEEIKVKTAAVKALGSFISFLSEETLDCFYNLIPPLLQCSLECQKRNDEDTVSTILDVLYDMAYSPSSAVNSNLNSIVRFCLGVMSDVNLEMTVRDSAALVVATMSESKPKTFGKDTVLMKATLDTIFNLIESSNETGAGALFQSNPAWREDEDDDADFDPEGDEATQTSMAQGTLDMLACEIPKKYIFEPVVEMCFARFGSPDENHRKAGIACLGVIAEGCTEPFREHLDKIMPIVLQAAKDNSASVRECSCFSLGQMSEHCQPEILSYSTQVLPIAFELLDDSSIAVQATSCYVLEMFCERLEPEDVRPLLDPLVRKLAGMLETTTKRSVQEMTIAALAGTAVAAEEEFAPYVKGIADLMSKPMSITDENMYSLRGRALECMGHIAIAVGKDSFRPYFPQTMQCACEGLTFESTDLHEFAYAVFANLAKVMEGEFSPCLKELVPHLLSVLKQEDGQVLERAEEAQGQFGGLDDSDDEDENGNYVLNVRTAVLEAKKGVITAIGEIGAHCGSEFAPYLEETTKLLQKASENFHPMIQSEVAEALPSMVVPMIAAVAGGTINWQKGDISGVNPMTPEIITISTEVLGTLIQLMDEEDKETVGKAAAGVKTVIEMCGPYALATVANECLEKTHSLLTKSAPCQLVAGEEEFEDDDDEHDSFMISVCDLLASFGRVMGPHFVQYLPQFLPPLCDFLKPARSATDRAMAIGCMGELAQELGDGIKEHWKPVFLPAILAGLADESSDVKRNAAFCAGTSCEGLGEHAVPDYALLLQAVGQLFAIDPTGGDSSAACVDNAAACISRMIMASPANVPLSQVLPVVLKALPLKNDMTENETVYKCILGLLQMNNPDAISQKAEIRRVFAEATTAESKVDDEMKEKLMQALPALN